MRFRTVSPALAAVAVLAACAPKSDTPANDTTAMGVSPAATSTSAGVTVDSGMNGMGTSSGTTGNNRLSDANTVSQVDAVIAAAQGGLTKLSPKAAIDALDPLREKLHNSGEPTLEKIADDLDDLKDELDNDKIDGRKVGGILQKLGTNTTAASSGSSAGAASAKLATLGKLLTTAGNSLAR